MAYRAFDEWQPAVAAGPLRAASTELRLEPGFTPTELNVLAIARLDSRHAGCGASRAVDFLARLFGIRRPSQLANKRLEALRRFAMLTLAGRASEADERRLLDAGFSPRALDLLKISLN